MRSHLVAGGYFTALLPRSGAKYRELMSDAEKHLGKATGKYEERVKARKGLAKRLQQLKKEGKVSPDEAEAAQVRGNHTTGESFSQ